MTIRLLDNSIIGLGVHINELLLFILAFGIYLSVLLIFRGLQLLCYVSFSLAQFHRSFVKNFGRVYSPDYFTASIYKELSGYNYSMPRKNYNHTVYVKSWNRYNLYITIFSYLALIVSFSSGYCIHLLFWACFVRFYSRCAEITVAFFKDVMGRQQSSISKGNTFLSKYERLQLAFTSYIEVYILSACMYLTVHPFREYASLRSMIDSLSVGSLTNVGRLVPTLLGGSEAYVFTQVFTTLVLVIVSLAVYVGRKK